MLKGTMSRNMKSISAEDLRTIVKRMINGAVENSEQMAKLHRAIYEELYFEKMTEFQGRSVEQNSSQNIFERELIQDISDCDELKKCEKDCTEKKEDFLLSGQGDNCKIEKTVNELEKISINKSPEESQTRTHKCEETTIIKTSTQSERSLDKHLQRNEQAFDIWRKEKTKAMRRMLKEERRKRQEELAAKEEEIERKKATHEAYLRSKKLLETQRKLEETQRRAMREDYSRIQDEENARIMANEEAFKAWIRRKNCEPTQRFFQPRRCRTQAGRTQFCNNVVFDSWLDQLDSVLHQKYLRERRYRVRSFYCQPAYYGTAALCMQ